MSPSQIIFTYLFLCLYRKAKGITTITGLGTTQDDPICIDLNDAGQLEVVVNSSNLYIHLSVWCLILLVSHDSGAEEATEGKYVIRTYIFVWRKVLL